jgi:hypothetical protein
LWERDRDATLVSLPTGRPEMSEHETEESQAEQPQAEEPQPAGAIVLFLAGGASSSSRPREDAAEAQAAFSLRRP